MLLNCGVEEDSWESLDGKEIKPVNPKRNQPWIFIGRTDLKLKLQYFGHLMQRAQLTAKDPMLGKSEGKRRRGDRGDGGTAALTQWTWVWANSRREWKTGKPGVLQSIGSKGVGHNWATEQQQLSLTILRYWWNNVTTDLISQMERKN